MQQPVETETNYCIVVQDLLLIAGSHEWQSLIRIIIPGELENRAERVYHVCC